MNLPLPPHRILQLLNQRFLEDLKSRWWEFNRKKCPAIENEEDGISIQNIGGVFLVIFIGIGLGLITLAFEYYWSVQYWSVLYLALTQGGVSRR